jgi:hypothetical protein
LALWSIAGACVGAPAEHRAVRDQLCRDLAGAASLPVFVALYAIVGCLLRLPGACGSPTWLAAPSDPVNVAMASNCPAVLRM